ncbi:MAG: hypothetical protein ACFFAH_00730 [Promethearchaeota archaeon]
MILKLIVKNNNKSKRNQITAWIQKHKDFESDIGQVFQFFKNNIKISEKRRFYKYYKVSSDNPAIIMSLFSTVYDLIPEIYFKAEECVG